jgi:tRNA (Thr-GGU) A37 N-methylase
VALNTIDLTQNLTLYLYIIISHFRMYSMNPIGFVSSIFTFKNGTPRQPSLCPYARGTLVIEKSLFNNPEHSLEDLDQFSHVW